MRAESRPAAYNQRRRSTQTDHFHVTSRSNEGLTCTLWSCNALKQIPFAGVRVHTHRVRLARFFNALPLELLQVGFPDPAVLLPVFVEQVLHSKCKHHLKKIYHGVRPICFHCTLEIILWTYSFSGDLSQSCLTHLPPRRKTVPSSQPRSSATRCVIFTISQILRVRLYYLGFNKSSDEKTVHV